MADVEEYEEYEEYEEEIIEEVSTWLHAPNYRNTYTNRGLSSLFQIFSFHTNASLG